MGVQKLSTPPGADPRAKSLRVHWGKAIARQRRLLMTQAELAEAVGVTQAAVAMWENGTTAPRPHHQAAIARALHVDWAVLFQPEAA